MSLDLVRNQCLPIRDRNVRQNAFPIISLVAINIYLCRHLGQYSNQILDII